MRFPFAGPYWEAATFLDFGQVWDEETDLDLTKVEITPGFGIRYFSPIGPIRIDIGYRFQGGQERYVVTKAIDIYPPGSEPPWDFSKDDLVVLSTPVLWGEELGRWSLRRFEFHLSIGQAF